MICRIINIVAMLNVKNTIATACLDALTPHYCCSCGAIGAVLCEGCKYDITSEPFSHCLRCLVPSHRGALCQSCHGLYDQAFVVGWRETALEKLIDASKFDSIREGCDVQAELLHSVLPTFPANTRLVPVSTIRPHIRRRGYGHVERIARRLADIRGCAVDSSIVRITNSVQHGATKSARLKQAKMAFDLKGTVSDDVTYIILDDVYTTGATIDAVARLLRNAGAKHIWIAVTSRQPK